MEQNKELKRAKNVAYRYLSIRPRSIREVEQKLRDREFTPSLVSSVIDHLLVFGYLDDRKFAEQWAAGRVRCRGFGRRRIERELRIRGVEQELIADTLRGLFENESELDIACRGADRKLRTLGRYDGDVKKRRLSGHLERKGFSAAIIREVLRRLLLPA